jgi:iron-sulfur cluster protein
MTRRRDLEAEVQAALTDPSIQQAVGPAARGVAARRLEAVESFAAYEAARDRARAIKERAIEDLPQLIETVTRAVAAAGGTVHRAADADAAGRIIAEIAVRESCTSAVKSKSMTSEEVHLNAALEAAGMTVRETDLGEYIVQLDGDRPSHTIAPILHKSLDDVRDVFRRALDLDRVPESPEELTQIARDRLRDDFLDADMGITGANFVIAESGSVVVVENEGNARMCTQVPRVHVALAGIEKLIPTIADLQPFLELLPRSATGQLLSVYLSIITGPGWAQSPLVEGDRTFDLVLLDNGRMAMRDDPVLREALYCVRCGACLNVCAPYQAVGGHVFGGETYQSGIGVAWETGVRGLDAGAEFAPLCSTCSRCHDVCPVRIDIPWMNSVVKGRVHEHDGTGDGFADSLLRDPRRLYEKIRSTPGSAWLGTLPPVRWYLEQSAGLDRRRPLPDLPPVTLTGWHAEQGGVVLRGAAATARVDPTDAMVVMWADCHTEHVEVDAGRAAVRVLQRLGYEVVVATGSCCGRAALSQGAIAEAREQAGSLLGLLEPFADAGVPIVGLEPSCLTCVVGEHDNLVPDAAGAMVVALRTQEIFQFLATRTERLDAVVQTAGRDRTIGLHGHCQQKSAGWLPAVSEVLHRVPGLRVETTSAECCGMAGSYGYKTVTYEVSRELGRRLAGELDDMATRAGSRGLSEVLACGTSCRAQIRATAGSVARHPIELLEEATR